ncbi:MAG: ATP-grasp domain-containing protein [Candidatus Bathyarchaeales archaeon]
MSIALLYERSETDEMGIKLTAQDLDIDIVFLPFRKIALTIGKTGFTAKTKGKDYTNAVKSATVVLNRAQSKNRRLQAGYLMEMLGKKTINSSQIEFICYSKLRTLLHFWTAGIPIPKTVYVPCDAVDTLKNGSLIHNEKDIADLLQNELALNEGLVIKPDAGTHGKGMMLSKNREQLLTSIQEIKPSIINPVGIVAQELIQKWFYDLRIIVSKEKGKAPVCHPVALARGGFRDFRTNTYLGNTVFDARIPFSIRELAVKCGQALGKGAEAWVLALDAMINVGENKTVDDVALISELKKAEEEYEKVRVVKQDETRFRDFQSWNRRLEEAFQRYKSTKPYEKIKNIIEESLEKNRDRVVFHEANSCPEFWEHTRLIAGMNVAVPLLKCAQSLI